jgi:hypothetical protein
LAKAGVAARRQSVTTAIVWRIGGSPMKLQL